MSPAPGSKEPVSLAQALDKLRLGGMLAPSAPSETALHNSENSKPNLNNNDDDDEDEEKLSNLSPWTDSPSTVLDRTDALSLSEVTWDEDAVLTAVEEIAELAHIPYTRIRTVDSPHGISEAVAELVDSHVVPNARENSDFGPPFADDVPRHLALRTAWGRYLGALTEYRWEDFLSRGLEHLGAPDAPVSSRRGRTTWALSNAEELAPELANAPVIHRHSVVALVRRYVGFMLSHGAWLDAPRWRPSAEVHNEFGAELQIGALVVDAFCSGLGYLALVDDELIVCRRPAVRILDTATQLEDLPRFHHDGGPAVEFADGSGSTALEGVWFPQWMYRAIIDGALTMRYVRDFPASEVRMAAYPSMPPDAFLDGLDARLVDVGSKGTSLYRVKDLPDHDGPIWYMVMTDPSTGRDHGEYVPPEVGEGGSADAAQAAAWGSPYRPIYG